MDESAWAVEGKKAICEEGSCPFMGIDICQASKGRSDGKSY